MRLVTVCRCDYFADSGLFLYAHRFHKVIAIVKWFKIVFYKFAFIDQYSEAFSALHNRSQSMMYRDFF